MKARKICAWCKADLGEIESPAGRNSHGLCPSCFALEKAKLAALSTEDIARLRASSSEKEAPVVLYVAGGEYARDAAGNVREFDLVRPTAGLPYVYRRFEGFYDLVRHHAHLYSFDPEAPKLLRLARESFEAASRPACGGLREVIGVGAPKEVELSGTLLSDLRLAARTPS